MSSASLSTAERQRIQLAIGEWYRNTYDRMSPDAVLFVRSPIEAEHLQRLLQYLAAAADSFGSARLRVADLVSTVDSSVVEPSLPGPLVGAALEYVARWRPSRLELVRPATRQTEAQGRGTRGARRAFIDEWRSISDRTELAPYGMLLAATFDFANWRAAQEFVDTFHRATEVYAFESVAIVVEEPVTIRTDPAGRPHDAAQAAIAWADGAEVFAWHGTRVPQDLIEGRWTIHDALRQVNMEVRRSAIEWHGGVIALIRAGAMVPIAKTEADPGNPGQVLTLYDTSQPGFRGRYLHCVDATIARDGTRREYALRVPPDARSPVHAAAWAAGVPVTKYRRLQVAR